MASNMHHNFISTCVLPVPMAKPYRRDKTSTQDVRVAERFAPFSCCAVNRPLNQLVGRMRQDVDKGACGAAVLSFGPTNSESRESRPA
jgi:hypothetical protein